MHRISLALRRRGGVFRLPAAVPIVHVAPLLCSAQSRLIHAAACPRAAPQSQTAAPPVQSAVSVQQAVDVLLHVAQWKSDNKNQGLTKSFQFKDAKSAGRFMDQVTDLRSRARRPFSHSLLESDTKSVVVSIPVESSGADAGKIGDEQVALAHTVDDIGAALQLQTGWG